MKKTKRPPRHLSKEAKTWWDRIMSEYEIEDEGGLLILQTALEALDRLKASQKTIMKEGMTQTDRFGQVRVHPLCAVERDARSQLLQALKNLNLDLEPLKDRGRPGGS